MLFCDDGSEFSSQIMDLWACQNGVRIDFSRPGKPTDNAFIETFNKTLRVEGLDTHWFATGHKQPKTRPKLGTKNRGRPASIRGGELQQVVSKYIAA